MTAAVTLQTLDFPLFGTRLIEASAGTGKTYTIAALYVRLILGHGSGPNTTPSVYLPPDILVVTFTDAATKELRERIRDRLSQAARYFRGQVGNDKDDEFLRDIRAAYAEPDWPACARRLELAANWMDESAVYTIHGWCNRMLQQHAFDSGSLFRQEVNTTDTELLHEVVRDYWRSFFYDAAIDEASFKKIYEYFEQPDDLYRHIRSLLGDVASIPPSMAGDKSLSALLASVDTAKQTYLSALKAPWREWADEIEALLITAVKNKVLPAKNYKANIMANWIAKIKAWAANPEQEILDIGVGYKSLTPAGLQALTNPGQVTPKHPGFEAIALLGQQLTQLPSLKVELIKHAAHWISQRYDTEKQRIARMTFDDMLTRLDCALQGENGPQLALMIRQQYPIALIDEFQDTDPIQYRIFSTLYPANANDGSGCFMIGDPKQAIYSFRGADIYTYLKAHQATLGNHYTLGTNFRSTKALVKAVNQVFIRADQQPEGAFRFKKADDSNPLPFIAVNAKGRNDDWLIDDKVASPLTVWHWQSNEPIGMPAYRGQMAEVTASEIVRLLNAATFGKQTGFNTPEKLKPLPPASIGALLRTSLVRLFKPASLSKHSEIVSPKKFTPLQPSDIAILVRTGHEAKVMRDALASRGLRSVYLSEGDSIFASREAADLLLWLKALAEPHNERRVRSALGTTTFGWPYQTLQRWAVDEPCWEMHLERFMGYQQRWRQDGILPALRQLIGDYQLHAQLMAKQEGERCMTNLLHLAELLQQASGQIEGEQALIRHLAELIEASGQTSNEAIIRLESDANLIKIITIHKSKGLEYPLVFLPFICTFREAINRNSDYYRYHDDQHNLTIDLGKSDSNQALNDAERLQEDLRLLYVALTRARYACWLGIAPIKSYNAKDCELAKSAIGHVLGWQAIMPASALEDKLKQLKGGCAQIAITKLPDPSEAIFIAPPQESQADTVRKATAKIINNWWVASYSSLQIAPKPAIDQTLAENGPALSSEPETAQEDKQADEADASPTRTQSDSAGVHSLPRGAAPGVLVHGLLEQCAQIGFAVVQKNPAIASEFIAKLCTSHAWGGQQQALLAEALAHWLAMPLLAGAEVSLATLASKAYQAEMEFLLGADTVDVQTLDQLVIAHIFAGALRPHLMPKQINGLLKGFIDLVFVHNQQYYVVDYKFNNLADDDSAYTPEVLATAMLAKRYDLQSALYLLALHRLLKTRLGDHYDYDKHVGGSLYLFLRGARGPAAGRVFYKPPRLFIEALDTLFLPAASQIGY